MSNRSGYTEPDGDYTEWDHIRWRGQVASSIRGRRGQNFLREMRDALDAMPDKRLIREELATEEGVCAIGSVLQARGIDATKLDPHDHNGLAKVLNIASPLVREIEWENDQGHAPEVRWHRIRQLIAKWIKP